MQKNQQPTYLIRFNNKNQIRTYATKILTCTFVHKYKTVETVSHFTIHILIYSITYDKCTYKTQYRHKAFEFAWGQIPFRSFMHWQIPSTVYVDGLVQDCSISSANALEILQSCTEPSVSHTICTWFCCAVFCFVYTVFIVLRGAFWFIYLNMFFRVVLLALGQSYHCPILPACTTEIAEEFAIAPVPVTSIDMCKLSKTTS